MVSGDFEERVGGGVEACRSLGFHELVLAVINALEGSGVLAALGLGDGHLATVNGVIVRGAIELVEPELRQIVLSRGATVEGLVDVQLVGEHNDLVGRGLAGFAFDDNIRVVGELKGSLIRVARRADHSVLVQRGRVFDGELATGGNGDCVVFSILDGLRVSDGDVEGVLISGILSDSVGASAKSLVAVLDDHGLLIEGQASGLLIVEDQLVGLVGCEVCFVRRQGSGQLERHFVVHIVIGGILPVGLITSGVVDVLDLLFEGRLVGLTVHGHRAVDLDDEQRCRVVAGHSILILKQVVASRSGQSRLGRNLAIGSTSQINVRGDGCQLCRVVSISTLSNLSSSIGSGLVRRIVLVEVLAGLDIAQRAFAQIAGEDLVHGVGVRVGRRHGDVVVVFSRHGGGGTGETGDGHCRGGCHSDEAFENLIHCSPFLSCLKFLES